MLIFFIVLFGQWNRTVILKLFAELSHMVLRMVFGNYSVENYCDSQIDALKFLMRFIKYRAPMNDDNNTGLHPHNDKSFLTVLDQNQVNRLEIQTKEGASINCSSCRWWTNGEPLIHCLNMMRWKLFKCFQRISEGHKLLREVLGMISPKSLSY